jgi:hypothetical protein
MPKQTTRTMRTAKTAPRMFQTGERVITPSGHAGIIVGQNAKGQHVVRTMAGHRTVHNNNLREYSSNVRAGFEHSMARQGVHNPERLNQNISRAGHRGNYHENVRAGEASRRMKTQDMRRTGIRSREQQAHPERFTETGRRRSARTIRSMDQPTRDRLAMERTLSAAGKISKFAVTKNRARQETGFKFKLDTAGRMTKAEAEASVKALTRAARSYRNRVITVTGRTGTSFNVHVSAPATRGR